MKTVIQPLAWGLALASILALASGVALDVVISTAQATPTHHEHANPSATPAPLREGMTRKPGLNQ